MRDDEAVRALLSARAVRERARQMLRLCEEDRLAHWRLDRSTLPGIADFTLGVMRESYPDLDIPFHARWRHFSAGGRDRWGAIAARGNWRDAASRARAGPTGRRAASPRSGCWCRGWRRN